MKKKMKVYYLVCIVRLMLGILVGIRIHHYCQTGFSSWLLVEIVIAIALSTIGWMYVEDSGMETKYVHDEMRPRNYTKKGGIQPIISCTAIAEAMILGFFPSHSLATLSMHIIFSAIFFGICWIFLLKTQQHYLKKRALA